MRGIFFILIFCTLVSATIIRDKDRLIHVGSQHAKVNYLIGKPWHIEHHDVFGFSYRRTGNFIRCQDYIPFEVEDENQLINMANAINAERKGRFYDSRARQTSMCHPPECIHDSNELHVCGGIGMPYHRWKKVTGTRKVSWDDGLSRGVPCDGGPLYAWRNGENFRPSTDGVPSDMDSLRNLVEFAHNPVYCCQLSMKEMPEY